MYLFVIVVRTYNVAGEPWCFDTTHSAGCIESDADATKEATPTFRLSSRWNSFWKSHSQVFSASPTEQWFTAASSHTHWCCWNNTTSGDDSVASCVVCHWEWRSSEHRWPTGISFLRFQFVSRSQLIYWVVIVIQRRPGSRVSSAIGSVQSWICCRTIRICTVTCANCQKWACTSIHWHSIVAASPSNDTLPFSARCSAYTNFKFKTASWRISTLARFPQDAGGN